MPSLNPACPRALACGRSFIAGKARIEPVRIPIVPAGSCLLLLLRVGVRFCQWSFLRPPPPAPFSGCTHRAQEIAIVVGCIVIARVFWKYRQLEQYPGVKVTDSHDL